MVMIETMCNFAHWLVLLGYYPKDNYFHSKVMVFDPYLNELRFLNVIEFVSMWKDGDYHINNIEKDFIAITN